MQILIIQTAHIGDVVLSTPVIEKLYDHYSYVSVDVLVKKGNEEVLAGHPKIRRVLSFKKSSKIREIWRLLRSIRKTKYDLIVNLHRYLSSGILTIGSGASYTAGFEKNPLSRFYNKRFPHVFSENLHEIERNMSLIEHLVGHAEVLPRLYPQEEDFQAIQKHQEKPYLTISPGSRWETKQLPKEKWVEFLNGLEFCGNIFLLGSEDDFGLCEEIVRETKRKGVRNLSGFLSMLQSTALMKGASMNYVHDSAPLHFASAMNAPVTAIFCSTVPDFGFGPLSDVSHVVETNETLTCRPCGIHGYDQCPKGHFKCAWTIDTGQIPLPD